MMQLYTLTKQSNILQRRRTCTLVLRNAIVVSSSRTTIRTTASSTTSSSTKTNTYRYDAISKTLYRQILKWTRYTGGAVPFGPIPPLTLIPPLIPKRSLEQLSIAKEEATKAKKDTKGSATATATITASANGNTDAHAHAHAQYDFYQRLISLLPSNSIVSNSKLVIPIENADAVKNATRVIFPLNHPNANEITNNGNGDNKGMHTSNTSNISDASQTSDMDNIKDRVSLGFEVLKSLNELSEMLDERKEARARHNDRDGVKFHVGQVVQHRTLRWRAIVAGWDKYEHENQDGSSSSLSSSSSVTSSLTTKDYRYDASTPEEEAKDNNIDIDQEGIGVEYTVFLDEGDAVLYKTRVLGSKKVRQQDLEAVVDPDLKRVRCSMASYYFDEYDSSTMEFRPGNVLMFEYPQDVDIDLGGDSDVDGSDSSSSSRTERARNDTKNISKICSRDENAIKITENIQAFASILKGHLSDIIVSSSVSAKASAKANPHHNLPFITDIEKELTSITEGTLLNTVPSDILSSSSSPPPPHKVAVQNLNSLLTIIQKVTQVMWQRRTAFLNKDRVRFTLGNVVRHKKFDLRGVVVGWDAYPRTDVTRWDQNVNHMPWYHLIVEINDTTRTSAQDRFRYVCEEHLELCSSSSSASSSLSESEQTNLEVELDDDWSVSRRRSSSSSSSSGSTSFSSSVLEYVAPSDVRFQHAEDLGTEDEEIVQHCMESLLSNISMFLKDMRDHDETRTYKDGDVLQLQLDDIFSLLQFVDCLEDAYIVEEFIKETWKVHEEPDVRWSLEDGTEAILSGDKSRALTIFDDLIKHNPDYLEAYNKKATCHYMLGEMKKSIEAAKLACDMEPRHFQAFAGLGLAYNDITQYNKATKYFRRSLGLQPWSPVSSRLSMCLDLLKKLDLHEDEG